MYFPYFHKISIEDLYYIFSNYESSDIPELRAKFRKLYSYSWRVIPRSPVFTGKFTFVYFHDLYEFIKFAYIVYPNLCLTLLYKAK